MLWIIKFLSFSSENHTTVDDLGHEDLKQKKYFGSFLKLFLEN